MSQSIFNTDRLIEKIDSYDLEVSPFNVRYAIVSIKMFLKANSKFTTIQELRDLVDNLFDVNSKGCSSYVKFNFSEASEIDWILFGHKNTMWCKAYDFPETGDVILDEEVKSVGILTFGF